MTEEENKKVESTAEYDVHNNVSAGTDTAAGKNAQRVSCPEVSVGTDTDIKDTKEIAVEEKHGNLLACLGWCPALFFVPLLTNSDETAKYNANQGALSLCLLIVVNLLDKFGGIFPYEIQKVFHIIMLVLSAAIVLAIVIGMVRGYNNHRFEFPVIGKIDLFKAIKGNN